MRLEFKKFLEEREEKSDYISGLEDELNIDPEHFKDYLSNNTVLAANIEIDGTTYSMVNLRVDPETVNDNYVRVTIEDPNSPSMPNKVYLKGGDNKLMKHPQGHEHGKTALIPRKQFLDILNQGWSPALQQQGGGPPQMGGMPPMGGPAL